MKKNILHSLSLSLISRIQPFLMNPSTTLIKQITPVWMSWYQLSNSNARRGFVTSPVGLLQKMSIFKNRFFRLKITKTDNNNCYCLRTEEFFQQLLLKVGRHQVLFLLKSEMNNKEDRRAIGLVFCKLFEFYEEG